MATENSGAPPEHKPYVPDEQVMPEFTWPAVLVGAALGKLRHHHVGGVALANRGCGPGHGERAKLAAVVVADPAKPEYR